MPDTMLVTFPTHAKLAENALTLMVPPVCENAAHEVGRLRSQFPGHGRTSLTWVDDIVSASSVSLLGVPFVATKRNCSGVAGDDAMAPDEFWRR
jgi:hypothetical protein